MNRNSDLSSQFLPAKLPASVLALHADGVWQFLSLAGFSNLPFTKEIFFSTPYATQYEWQAALHQTAQAKVLSLEGNFLGAKKSLAAAEYRIHSAIQHKETKDHVLGNVAAYVYYELSILHGKTRDLTAAEHYLKTAYSYKPKSKLRRILNYSRDVIAFRSGNLKAINAVRSHASYFSSMSMPVLSLFARREVARHLIQHNELVQARQLLNKIIIDANENGLWYNQQLAMISLARCLFKESKYAEMDKLVTPLYEKSDSHFIRAYAAEWLVLSLEAQDEMQAGISLLEASLINCIQNNVLARIIPQAVFLGEKYELELHQLAKSAYYYQLGYDHAVLQLEIGYSMNGDRKLGIERHIQFLNSHLPRSLQEQPVDPFFDFALGKSWKEIKDRFHYNLVVYHRMNTGKTGKLLDVLKMPATSYYSLLERLKERGIVFPKSALNEEQLPSDQYHEPLQRYIDQYKQSTWTDINHQFEQDIFKFLYEHYGYSKQRLAKMLELSYSVVINKTRPFTEAEDLPANQPASR